MTWVAAPIQAFSARRGFTGSLAGPTLTTVASCWLKRSNSTSSGLGSVRPLVKSAVTASSSARFLTGLPPTRMMTSEPRRGGLASEDGPPLRTVSTSTPSLVSRNFSSAETLVKSRAVRPHSRSSFSFAMLGSRTTVVISQVCGLPFRTPVRVTLVSGPVPRTIALKIGRSSAAWQSGSAVP